MATRIRYENFEDPHGQYNLVSVRNFHSNKYKKNEEGETDSMYIVYIDTKYVTYMIRNMTSGREFSGGENINNLHVLKRNVKDKLSKLGVTFDDEIRDNASRVKGVNCGYKRKEVWDLMLATL